MIEYLPVGEYILHEETAPEGYVIANDVKFVVEETGEIQKVEMQDERAMGRLKIRKTEEGSKKTLEGVCRPFCRSSSLRGHEPDFLAPHPGISV